MIPLLVTDPWESLASALRRLPDLAEAARTLPAWAAVGLLLTGAAALAVGSAARRPLGAAGGALAGAAAGAAAAGWVAAKASVPPLASTMLCAGAVAILAGIFPPVFIFAAGALPGALVGWAFPLQGEPALGLAAGAVLGGAVALLAARWVAALTAAGLGAALVAAGLFGLAGGSPVLQALEAHPVALLAVLAVLTVAGAAFQHPRAWRGEAGKGKISRPASATPASEG